MILPNHTCSYYCHDDTHAQVLYGTGTWAAEEILEHMHTYANKFSIDVLTVTPAPEAPPPKDVPGQRYIGKDGTVSTRRYKPYSEGWLVTFRWKQKQLGLFSTTEEG